MPHEDAREAGAESGERAPAAFRLIPSDLSVVRTARHSGFPEGMARTRLLSLSVSVH